MIKIKIINGNKKRGTTPLLFCFPNYEIESRYK